MKHLKNILLFILFVNFSFSQNDLNQGFDLYGRDNPFIAINPEKHSNIKGSQYLDDNYLTAQISNFPNQVFSLRYNLFTDKMEFKNKEGKIFTLKKNDDYEVTFINKKLTYKLYDYKSKNKDEKGYFLVLLNGKNNLLKKQKVVFVKDQRSNSGYDNHRPPQFKRLSDTYYIKLSNNALVVEAPKNKKKIAELFPENKSEILKFIKSNKIKLSKDADFKKLINFINSL